MIESGLTLEEAEAHVRLRLGQGRSYYSNDYVTGDSTTCAMTFEVLLASNWSDVTHSYPRFNTHETAEDKQHRLAAEKASLVSGRSRKRAPDWLKPALPSSDVSARRFCTRVAGMAMSNSRRRKRPLRKRKSVSKGRRRFEKS